MRLACRVAPLLALLAAAACNRGDAAAGTPAAGVDSGAAAAAAAPPDTGALALDPRAVRADTARIAGDAAATLWVIEASDYQCPYCRRFHEETFPAIEAEYVRTGKVRFAYVHMPLPMHANAAPASEAAMCAGAQGKFWGFHDALFDAQQELTAAQDPRPLFDGIARSQGLDQAAFARCLDDDVMQPVVMGDFERMRQAGVNSTPTFFVGNTKIEGAQPIAVFRRTIDSALAAAAPAGGR